MRRRKHPIVRTPKGEVGMEQTWVTFGCPPTLKQQAEEVADDQGISLSELARKAIAQYIGVE